MLKSAAGAGWFDLSCRTTGAKVEGGLSRGEVSPGVFSLTVLMFLKLLIVLMEVISAEGRLRRFLVQSKVQPQCICNGWAVDKCCVYEMFGIMLRIGFSCEAVKNVKNPDLKKNGLWSI